MTFLLSLSLTVFAEGPQEFFVLFGHAGERAKGRLILCVILNIHDIESKKITLEISFSIVPFFVSLFSFYFAGFFRSSVGQILSPVS